MKIHDCNLNPGAISMSPFIRTEAEELWIQARDNGTIPLSLFELYRKANYLSFGSAPPFLRDDEGVLFSYFCLLVRSIMLSLVDANDQISEFTEARKHHYYPGKADEDPSWTREKSEAAAKRSNDAFRGLLISLHSALDALSELIALFSQGKINNLQLGYSQFSRIEGWLKSDKRELSAIASPLEVYLDQLYDVLRPMIHADPPEAEWLPYMRLLRNKSTHLGHALFRSLALRGNDGMYYTFIPREWPYLWEKYMKPEDVQPSSTMSVLLTKTLAHQDIIEYAHGALRKVTTVINDALVLTAKAFTDFSSFEFNQAAMDELIRNSKEFQFEHFL